MSTRVSLKRIDEIVSARLGPGRVADTAPQHSRSRQVSMYLAHTRFGWSVAMVGHFYNRHHTTVCYAIKRIACLLDRETSLRHLLDELQSQITDSSIDAGSLRVLDTTLKNMREARFERLADLVAERVYARLCERMPTSETL